MSDKQAVAHLFEFCSLVLRGLQQKYSFLLDCFFHINKKCLISTKKVSKTEYNYTFAAPEPKYDKNGNCISGEYTPRAILKIATKGVKLVIPDNDNTATSYELAIHN